MKKLFSMIFALLLLVAVPFSQASDISPPQSVEYVITQDVVESAIEMPEIEVPGYYLYDLTTAMDAAILSNNETTFLQASDGYDYCSNQLDVKTHRCELTLKNFIGPGDKQSLFDLC